MSLNPAVHKNILIRILKDIYSDATVGPYLGFKGGTAVFLFHGQTRFSVDLDFDLLDATKQEYVFDQIKKILETLGTVKQAQNKRYSLFFLLSYQNKQLGAQNIKVEINKRDFGSRYEIRHYLGIPMKVMIPEDIVAHKLVAMYERKANRDIFDVWFFLHNNWPINTKIIEQRTGMSYKKFLKECIELLNDVSERTILSGIGELLDEKQKAWAKKNLKTETIFLLKLALN